MPDHPNPADGHYDTWVIDESEWRETWTRWVADGWESSAPDGGSVVYLRKHVSGPVSADDGKWRKERTAWQAWVVDGW